MEEIKGFILISFVIPMSWSGDPMKVYNGFIDTIVKIDFDPSLRGKKYEHKFDVPVSDGLISGLVSNGFPVDKIRAAFRELPLPSLSLASDELFNFILDASEKIEKRETEAAREAKRKMTADAVTAVETGLDMGMKYKSNRERIKVIIESCKCYLKESEAKWTAKNTRSDVDPCLYRSSSGVHRYFKKFTSQDLNSASFRREVSDPLPVRSVTTPASLSSQQRLQRVVPHTTEDIVPVIPACSPEIILLKRSSSDGDTPTTFEFPWLSRISPDESVDSGRIEVFDDDEDLAAAIALSLM